MNFHFNFVIFISRVLRNIIVSGKEIVVVVFISYLRTIYGYYPRIGIKYTFSRTSTGACSCAELAEILCLISGWMHYTTYYIFIFLWSLIPLNFVIIFSCCWKDKTQLKLTAFFNRLDFPICKIRKQIQKYKFAYFCSCAYCSRITTNSLQEKKLKLNDFLKVVIFSRKCSYRRGKEFTVHISILEKPF